MIIGNRQPPEQPVRSVIYLDDFGMFFLGGRGGRGKSSVDELRFHQEGVRDIRVTGDSKLGIGNALTLRVWLALLVIFERAGRPEDGLIEFTRSEIASILGRKSDGGAGLTQIGDALNRIDQTYIRVTGKPLDGPPPDTESSSNARAKNTEYTYRLIAGDGTLADRDAEAAEAIGDLRMVADSGELLSDARSQIEDARARERRMRRSTHISTRRLGPYVTACLVGRHGRLVPKEVFLLRRGYAIRLMCLLGTRANGKASLRISRTRLAEAIPCVDTAGQPLAYPIAVRSILRACEELSDVGFLTSYDYDRGTGMFAFGFPSSSKASRPREFPPPLLAPEVAKTERHLKVRATPGPTEESDTATEESDTAVAPPSKAIPESVRKRWSRRDGSSAAG